MLSGENCGLISLQNLVSCYFPGSMALPVFPGLSRRVGTMTVIRPY